VKTPAIDSPLETQSHKNDIDDTQSMFIDVQMLSIYLHPVVSYMNNFNGSKSNRCISCIPNKS